MFLVCGTLWFSCVSAHAASDSWTGATNSNFSGLNWNTSGSVPPTNGDSLIFASGTGAGGTMLTDDYFTSGSSIAGITFAAGGVSFTINPNTPGTNGFTLGAAGITNSSTVLQTINDAIVLSATSTIAMTAAGGNITLGGVISGAGGGITTSGTGIVTLSAANTYSGTTKLAVATGTLAIGISETLSGTSVANGAIGTGTLNLNAGTLTVTSGNGNVDNVIVLSGPATIGGSIGVTFNGSGGSFTNSGGNNTLTGSDSGGVTLAGNIYLSETTATARDLILSGSDLITITGTIANANGVAASGTLNYNAPNANGELILSNSNSTYANMFLQGSGTLGINTNEALSGTSVANGPIGTGTFFFSGGVLAALGNARSIDNITVLGASATIGGVNAITFNGTGGSFTNSGGNRSLAINDIGGVTLAGPVYLSEASATSRTLIITGTAPLTISGSIANWNGGVGTPSELEINMSGTGETILSSANSTFSGTMDIQGGTTAINAAETVSGGLVTNGPIGTGTLELNNGVLIATGGARSIDNPTAMIASTAIGGANAITFNSSAGSFTNSGGNRTLTVSDSGGVTLGGTLNLSETSATGRNFTIGGASNVTISGPVLGAAAGTSTMSGTLTLASTATGNIESGSIGQAVLVVINNAGQNWTFSSGNSTYSGSTILTNGTLAINASDTVSTGVVTQGPLGTGTLELNGGVLVAAGGAQTIDN
ncbi:MAG TPA: hypothetical protein VHI52_05985, partial [Verrucomicrobiae bacterium]|nr:hypothetical protein [Verrucomicrobiae bacterium]